MTVFSAASLPAGRRAGIFGEEPELMIITAAVKLFCPVDISVCTCLFADCGSVSVRVVDCGKVIVLTINFFLK